VSNAENQMTLHTSKGCSMGVKRKETGKVLSKSCVNSTDDNAGCGVSAGSNTFGATYNSNGGGVMAMELRSEGIRMWQFLRNAIPALKNVLIPTLTQAFSNIPIPPINISNEKYDISFTNINLAAQDLIPEKIRIHFTNDIIFDFSPASRDLFVSSLYVKLQDFNAYLKDMNYRYDRKKMPAMTDVGIADVEMSGTTIEIRWRMDMVGQKLCFYVDDCRCFTKEFKTTIKESRHTVLNKIALTFMNASIKRNIEETVENMIRTKLVQFSIDTSLPLSDQLPLAF